ncbi:ABC transporter permease [Alsobacter sp. SYSU M60028]|uniref:ABC transporter permease n=1 Tax=Alsobacter ponti TaxID=2962936 RepID=A0ABT1LID6_9HYPH|nr:ABC transporter permease [Alsobacter ponti]MCP8940658.1 ABC transporter permease [Alsobacter ponti]
MSPLRPAGPNPAPVVSNASRAPAARPPAGSPSSARPRARRGFAGPLAGLVLLALWEAATRLLAVPAWVLPAPSRVLTVLVTRADVILPEAAVTLGEIVCGLAVGGLVGVAAGLAMARWPLVERAVGPALVASQALPVFAIAPLLVVWFGFGIGSKVAMSSLIIFFPVATSFLEGLRRTPPGLVDLARLYSATPAQLLWLVRAPSALPSLAAGLRIAAAVAPIGAIVGEWVGASSGLGLLILHANARMQTDTVFAALVVLALISIALWAAVDAATRRLVRWAPDTLSR